jgi:hypothetical protein
MRGDGNQDGKGGKGGKRGEGGKNGKRGKGRKWGRRGKRGKEEAREGSEIVEGQRQDMRNFRSGYLVILPAITKPNACRRRNLSTQGHDLCPTKKMGWRRRL